jgi:hypothetical protein
LPLEARRERGYGMAEVKVAKRPRVATSVGKYMAVEIDKKMDGWLCTVKDNYLEAGE